MRKVIAGINITLDGYCDHDSVIADAEIHEHFNAVLRNAGLIMWRRITYQLMEYWRPMVGNLTGNKAMDELADVIHRAEKRVRRCGVFGAGSRSGDWTAGFGRQVWAF